MKRIISLLLVLLLCMSVMLVATPASADTAYNSSNAKAYLQRSDPWGTWTYGGKTIRNTGCGILSSVNALNYLNGLFPTSAKAEAAVKAIADYAYANDAFNGSVGGGTARTYFFGTDVSKPPLFEKGFGEKYGFKIKKTWTEKWNSANKFNNDPYFGNKSYNNIYVNTQTELKEALAGDCVAIGHVPGHFICLADYNPATDKFLLLDCAPVEKRHNADSPVAWYTADELSGGWPSLTLGGYCILESTTIQPPDTDHMEWLSMEKADGGVTYEGSQQTGERWMSANECLQGSNAYATTITGSQFFFFLHPDSTGGWKNIDASQAKYVSFDLYVSKDLDTSKIADAGFNVSSNTSSWDNGGTITSSFKSALQATPTLTKGWHSFTLPINWSNASFDTTNLCRGRIYMVYNESLNGTEVAIDDLVVLTDAGKTEHDKRNLAKAATIAIRQIPALDSITFADEAVINAAATALAAVPNSHTPYILADTDLVSDAQAKIESLRADGEAAQAAMDKINALPNPVTLSNKLSVVSARLAYNKLTDTQKALVTNYDKLVAAEAKIAELQAAADKEAADKAAAQTVLDQIAALNVQSLADEAAVVAARAAYTALTDDQKALVNNVAALEAAEAKIAELKTPADVKNGPVDGYFYDNGTLVKAYKVVSFEGNYYFVADGNRIVTNNAMAMSASLLAGTDLPAGYYTFDANGVMTPATGVYGGKYYKNGVTDCLYQVVEFEGNYYFVSDGYRVATNTTTYLDAKFTENVGLTKGLYAFDENGVMSPATDIYMGKYYENGQNAKLYRVVEFKGNYYYVSDRYKVLTNTTMVLSAAFMTEVDLPAGCYHFAADGKMSPATGVYDGKYYKDGVNACLYQVVEFEGNYYFVDNGYRVAKNTTVYLGEAFTANVGLPKGLYAFDANGVMTPATDIYLGKYYENSQPAKLYQVIEFKGNYYYVGDRYKVATNTAMYLSAGFTANVGLPAGAYQFDENGIMTPATGVVDGKYYENGKPAKLYQLVESDGNYYFVSDGYRVVKNTTVTLKESMTAPFGLPAGTYEFDAEGKMILD